MTSPWVNKYAIMRDLSMVQGSVPVDIAGTVSAGDRPPSQDIVEETEEEFYLNCVGGDSDCLEPDLHLIKHMLDMVQNYDVRTDTEVEPESEKIIEISKLDPPCSNVIQPMMNNVKTHQQIKIRPKRKQRNAAMASLLLNLENEENSIKTSNNEPVKLLKPADFSNIEPEAIKKVNGWFNAQEKTQATIKPRNTKLTLNVNPTTMFKKKDIASLPKAEKDIFTYIKPTVEAELNVNPVSMIKMKDFPPLPKVNKNVISECYSKIPHIKEKTAKLIVSPVSMFKKKLSPSPSKPERATVESKKPGDVYTKFVPSTKAANYYKKFLESSIMKEMVTEDVWARAERQMKEIDERRKHEAELFALSLALSKSKESTSSPATSTNIDNPILDVVRLPQHRHTLKGQCVVCAVMTKKDPKSEHELDITYTCSSDDDDNGNDHMDFWRARAEETVNGNIENWRLEKVHDENIDSWRQSDADTIGSEAKKDGEEAERSCT